MFNERFETHDCFLRHNPSRNPCTLQTQRANNIIIANSGNAIAAKTTAAAVCPVQESPHGPIVKVVVAVVVAVVGIVVAGLVAIVVAVGLSEVIYSSRSTSCWHCRYACGGSTLRF